MKTLEKIVVEELGIGSGAAEGLVTDTDTGERVHVTVYVSDVEAYSVSKESALAFLCGGADEPAELTEEYGTLRAAKKSGYAEAFVRLRNAVDMTGVIG